METPRIPAQEPVRNPFQQQLHEEVTVPTERFTSIVTSAANMVKLLEDIQEQYKAAASDTIKSVLLSQMKNGIASAKAHISKAHEVLAASSLMTEQPLYKSQLSELERKLASIEAQAANTAK